MAATRVPLIRRLIRLALALAIILALLGWVGFSVVLPRVAQSRIKTTLEAQGFGEVHLLRPDIGLYRTTVANLSIGDPARPRLEVASATITYLPSELMAGRVQDVLLNGLLLRLESSGEAASRPMKQLDGPTTLPADLAAATTRLSQGPAGEPLFRSAILSNARVELVDPQTQLPTNLLIDAQAKSSANRTIDFSITAGYGGMTATLAGSSDPSFETIDANLTARGITLELAQPFLTGPLPLKLRRPAEIDAKLHVDRTTNARIDLPALTVRIPAASMDVGNQKSVDITDLALNVSGSLHRYGTDWYGMLAGGPLLTVSSIAAPQPFKPVPLTVTVAPTYLRINPNAWGINGAGAAIDIDDKRFGVDVAPFTFGSSPGGIAGSASATLRDVQLQRNPFIEKIVPEVRQWNISGKLSGSASMQVEKGAVKPRFAVRLDGCSLKNLDYQLKIDGLNAAVAFVGFKPLRSEADQSITAKYVQMGKWEIVGAEARFQMPGELRPTILATGLPGEGQIISVTRASFGWAGGDVWCTPFDVNLAHPRIRTELGAKDLDLSKVLWVASNQKAWAEGIVDMNLWADYSWPSLRFGKGWATSRPDWRLSLTDPTKGQNVILHLPDSAQQLDNWLRMRDPRFQDSSMLAPVRKQLVGTIENFYVDDFRADFSRQSDGKQLTAISLHGSGRGAAGETTDSHRLDLNLTITDLDVLISHFLKVYSNEKPQ